MRRNLADESLKSHRSTMPQQLIYTSAPRGIVAGRSGHCTVARSALLREALVLQLEKFCYYQHLSLSGGQERPIFACRIVDIRGSRFHVLSRIQDAGLDFTGRTNFIAHHLVFTPEEIRQFPTPPVILGVWPGWVKSWTKEPQLLEDEEWTELTALAGKTNVPAQTWHRITGDAVNGYGLLEARAGASFRVDDQTAETILGLLAESLELLEVRDTRRDFRTAAWNYTFTTSMQEQDNPADFRWRCIHSDNPAANRFATPDCRALSAVRATKGTGEETAFARTGRQAPRFVAEPQDARITEGETARFSSKAEGVPNPMYQWFSVDRANDGLILAGETNPELTVSNPAFGVSRYMVNATNSAGDVQSRVATLSVEQKLKLSQARLDTDLHATDKPAASYVKSEEDIERQRKRLESEQAQEMFQKRLRRKKILVTIFAIILIAGASAGLLMRNGFFSKSLSVRPSNAFISKKESDKASPPPDSTQPAASTDQSGSSEPANNTSTPSHFSEGAVSLPSPWTSKNVGNTSHPQASLYDNENETFTLTAQKGEMLPTRTSDSFFFASRPWSNSVEFSARFSTSEKIGASRCGIMLRESDSADSPFVFVGSTENQILWIQRASSRTNSTQITIQRAIRPVYFRLVHQDDSFSGDFSIDGQSWQPVSMNQQVHLKGSNYLIGFALCSGKNHPVQADFDTVKIERAKR